MADLTKKDLEKKLKEMEEKLQAAESVATENSIVKDELEEARQQIKEAQEEALKLKEENKRIKQDTEVFLDPDKVDINDGKMVYLTFAPQFSAKSSITIILKKKDQRVINGQTVVTKVPAIEGLPESLTIRRKQRFPVTKNQFRELYKLGWIAKTQETDSQKELFESIEGTFPDEYRISKEASIYENITSPQTIQQIYSDKLRVVE